MSDNNKIILRVRKDRNGYFQFSKGNKRLQLAGDSRPGKDGFWLKQYALKAGKVNFMKDFREILELMEQDNAQIFSLYEMPEVIRGELSDV